MLIRIIKNKKFKINKWINKVLYKNNVIEKIVFVFCFIIDNLGFIIINLVNKVK